MRSSQIYKEILSLTDQELLNVLPTIKKECCEYCKSINIRKRKKDGTFYCNECRKAVSVIIVTYYWKNKTANPLIAIERHRIFWNKIYLIELLKECYL